MNTDNGKGAKPSRIKFGLGCHVLDVNVVTDLEVMRLALGISSEKAFVNGKLTSIAQGKEISDKWDVKEHIAREGEGSR